MWVENAQHCYSTRFTATLQDMLHVFCRPFYRTRNGSRDLTKLRRRRQRERVKPNGFHEQNNNSARASRFFVHFLAVPAQQRREMTKFYVDMRTGTVRR